MVWHGDGLLRATARPVMAVLGGLTLSITIGNKGNKGSWNHQTFVLMAGLDLLLLWVVVNYNPS